MEPFEIIKLISQSQKKSPVHAFFKGNLEKYDFSLFAETYQGIDFIEVYDEFETLSNFMQGKNEITLTRLEIDRRNSAIPLADLTKYNARIEPGALIREAVEIGEKCVIMMGAVINIGAVIGKNTMIDMNAVIGGRAIVGDSCHIGAGAVLAGVIEPPSAAPVTVEDNVVIGANAVVLEGVKIGQNSVVAAGSVVTKEVPPFSVVAGVPAKVIKQVDDQTRSKTKLIEALRNI